MRPVWTLRPSSFARLGESTFLHSYPTAQHSDHHHTFIYIAIQR
jgi:hypothetical protein